MRFSPGQIGPFNPQRKENRKKASMASATKIVRMEAETKRVSVAGSRLLTPLQASEFLGVPSGTLAQWRSQGRGPQYVKLEGRLVRYRTLDLERYISSRMVETEVPLAIR